MMTIKKRTGRTDELISGYKEYLFRVGNIFLFTDQVNKKGNEKRNMECSDSRHFGCLVSFSQYVISMALILHR